MEAPYDHQMYQAQANFKPQHYASLQDVRDTKTQHLHEETSILPIKQPIELHASQVRQKTQHSEHTHQFKLHPQQPRDTKHSYFIM